MTLKSRNSEAIFRIFSQEDSSFAIEVVVPESSPTTVSSFPTEQAAESWIASYKERLEISETRGRRTFRGRAKATA